MKRCGLGILVSLSLAWGLSSACGSSGGAGDLRDAGDLVAPDAADPGPSDPGPAEGIGDLAGDEGIGTDAPDAADVPPYANGARASVAASADALIGGPMAMGTTGDIVLQNRLVRFVVRNQARSLYSPYAGAIVDADRVRPDGEPGHDQFFELFPMVGFGRVFMPSKMDIVDTGEFSGTAVVRFTGSDGGMSMIDSILPTASLGLEVTTDYVLAPDARHLEIVTRLRNAGGVTDPVDVGQLMQLGKRLVKFHDGCGMDADCLASASGTRWLAGADGDVSYALTVPAPGGLSLLLNVEELLLLKAGSFTLGADEEATVRQYLVVGNGTIEDVVAGVRQIRGEAEGTAVEVDVTPGDARTDLAKAWVQVRTAGAGATGGWVTATAPGPDGKAVVHLPAGDYDFVVSVPGASDATVTGVHVGDAPGAPVALAANPAGWLRVRVADPQGHPVTAALSLQAGAGAAASDAIAFYDIVHDGDRTFPMLPGTYTANVAKGLVWTLDRKDVTVTAGTVADLAATIEPAIDTTGYRMLNTHEHSEWSPDSRVTVEDRVWNAIGNGIDLMNSTDHDHFGSRQATIAALGVGDRVAGFEGCEVSPMWGHTTAAGCRNPPAYETYYAVDFVEYDETGTMVRLMTASEIYRQARDQFQCDFLAVNHPYRSEGTFNLYKIDGTSDPALAQPDLDLHLVDGMEVYNKSDDIDSILTNSLPAWFNLLNRGYSMAAIGGSDEHGLAGSYGSPRNMVPVTKPLGDAGLQAEVFGQMKAFRHEVVGGPVIWLTVGGATMGDTVTAAGGGTVQVHLRVLAPTWMGLEFVKLYANGAVVRDIVPSGAGEVVRVDETFDLTLVADSHIEAAAGSTLEAHRMGPVSPRMPFSVTNPVFVDVDGGGYTPIHANGAPWDAK